ncbi:hypothetical protein [Caviibacterium pharyngocola]|uniref:Uncharacterized protein n=1 Tax=Caviibacterium pharyngocola TaxID=28159 RepID=A0A2M8RVJ0_9PAST|nr:hypothetical protein [Caviibacterium pharyngocola]PJG82903.1 hypothetical protein CVP04_05910 [Caviibacterium pharyngocola]
MLIAFFKKILSWFAGSDKAQLINEYEKPKLIDTKELEKELDIVNQAKRLGEQNIPYSTDTVLSGPEAKIIDEVEKYRTKYSTWRDARLNIQDKNLTELVINVKTDLNKALNYPEQFKQELNNCIDQSRSELNELERKYKNLKQELEIFKAKHGLTRDAKIVSGGKNS